MHTMHTMHTMHLQEGAGPPTPTKPGSRKGSSASILSPWASPTGKETHGHTHVPHNAQPNAQHNVQHNVQPSRRRKSSVWGLVQNPFLRADAAREREETPSTTIARWSSFKRRVVAVLVITCSLLVLTAAFYLVIGPLMSQMTHKPETTRFVLATRQDPNAERRPRPRFEKPWGRRPRGAVEQDGCMRGFANCSSAHAGGWSTAYRCARPGVCEPWKAGEHCLTGGARFDTMNKCRRSCHNGASCTVAEACPCRGDYRTANYVHRARGGCRRLADHLCLVQPAQGFATLALCQRECGAQGRTTGQPSARCDSTASTRPCGWEDRQHRVFWDGRVCRPWDASVCPPDAYRDRKTCRQQCVERADHSAAAATKAQ